ncbi:hypothetical protein M4D81_29735 [Paenibacillus sp. p3-SID867]|nr:hypothetical protein [Paenibacillus sp. p3-SID867]MCT1403180.1 hypothetical protein [Paenibacillus sp. p3-SID867]
MSFSDVPLHYGDLHASPVHSVTIEATRHLSKLSFKAVTCRLPCRYSSAKRSFRLMLKVIPSN